MPESTALARLRGLLEIAHAIRAEDGLGALLETVARSLATSVGWQVVVVNLLRPAYDDYEVVVAHGTDEDGVTALLGTTNSRATWDRLLDPRFERRGAFLPAPDDGSLWTGDLHAYVPKSASSPSADAWHPNDALFVPMEGAAGELLGVLSLDLPRSGRGPTDAQLDLIVAVAAHASSAIENAQAAAESRRHRSAVEHLLAISSQLAGRRDLDETLDAVCHAIRDALGFKRVLATLAEGPAELLVTHAAVGFSSEQRAMLPRPALATWARLLDVSHEREGCVLVTRRRALEVVPTDLTGFPAPDVTGLGERAWRGHWLIVPLRDRDGATIGTIWADDPIDQMLPTTESLQALRAFANQAAAAIGAARQLDDLRYLAEHDPLTGLRNRRGFEARMSAGLASGAIALLICDLDRFKQVNDSLGHSAGDDVLRRFARVLRSATRGGETPTRLGGEEFAVVLEGADSTGAMRTAERLREAARREFAGFEVPISVSFGVAVCGAEAADAPALMRAANRALYAAKRFGRDRSVLYDARTQRLLLDLDAAGSATGEQLAATMLLAGMLDLRDPGTSRHSDTVGRLSQLVATQLGWPADRVERMRTAGVLHDIGKLGISDAILYKPGPLDALEWVEIQRHPELGARILEHANLPDLAGWVLRHHERIDGRGYPGGVLGDDIPIEARILAVADAYEAMTADRPYRAAMTVGDAEAELRACAGAHFDAAVVDALLAGLCVERAHAVASADVAHMAA